MKAGCFLPERLEEGGGKRGGHRIMHACGAAEQKFQKRSLAGHRAGAKNARTQERKNAWKNNKPWLSGGRFSYRRRVSAGREREQPMSERPPMEICAREEGGVHVLEIHGRLTIGEPSEQLNEALQELVRRGGRKVVINLNGVPQIDSSGISSLVKISIQLAREGGAAHLVCGAGRVRDALTVTRLVEAIPTFDSEARALAAFA